MDLEKVQKQWDEYQEEFNAMEIMDIETHTGMALQVGTLLKEIKRLSTIIEQNNIPLNPCLKCGKEERNPGLSVCGECYHKQITGKG